MSRMRHSDGGDSVTKQIERRRTSLLQGCLLAALVAIGLSLIVDALLLKAWSDCSAGSPGSMDWRCNRWRGDVRDNGLGLRYLCVAPPERFPKSQSDGRPDPCGGGRIPSLLAEPFGGPSGPLFDNNGAGPAQAMSRRGGPTGCRCRPKVSRRHVRSARSSCDESAAGRG